MENLNDLIKVSTTLFYLNDLNTYVLDKEDSIILAFEHNRLPDFLSDIQNNTFWGLRKEIEQNEYPCCLYRNELGFSYIASRFERKTGESNLLVNGPFLIQTPDMIKIAALVNPDKKIILKEFLGGLKLISRSKVQSMANVLYHSHSLEQVVLHTFDEHKESVKQINVSDRFKILQQPDEEYNSLIELRYKLQKEVMYAISQGNKAKGQPSFSELVKLADFSERLPNQPVRVMKNLCIIFNTLFRIAAENGGVPPFFLHHISEKFAIQIERVEHLDSLVRLVEAMYSEYCDLVKQHEISGYSLLIQKAISFLKINYSQPLNLEKLSQYCFVHPAHLSRQFKKETGVTLTDFLNKIRIAEAKKNLRIERVSIELIAENSGFSDAGYFTRVFKKAEGMTPSQYRNSK